jgi:hypothetical protein
MPTPANLKSMDETIALMAVKPADLTARLKRSFRTETAMAVEELDALIEETLTLVEIQVPAFDTAPYRASHARRRTAYDKPPTDSGSADVPHTS